MYEKLLDIYLRDSELEMAERTTKMAAISCNLSISRKLQYVVTWVTRNKERRSNQKTVKMAACFCVFHINHHRF